MEVCGIGVFASIAVSLASIIVYPDARITLSGREARRPKERTNHINNNSRARWLRGSSGGQRLCQTCRAFAAILDGPDCTLALALAVEGWKQTNRHWATRSGVLLATRLSLKWPTHLANWLSETSTIFCSREFVAQFDRPHAIHLGPDRLGVDFFPRARSSPDAILRLHDIWPP
jgi:hypothetical protein